MQSIRVKFNLIRSLNCLANFLNTHRNRFGPLYIEEIYAVTLDTIYSLKYNMRKKQNRKIPL